MTKKAGRAGDRPPRADQEVKSKSIPIGQNRSGGGWDDYPLSAACIEEICCNAGVDLKSRPNFTLCASTINVALQCYAVAKPNDLTTTEIWFREVSKEASSVADAVTVLLNWFPRPQSKETARLVRNLLTQYPSLLRETQFDAVAIGDLLTRIVALKNCASTMADKTAALVTAGRPRGIPDAAIGEGLLGAWACVTKTPDGGVTNKRDGETPPSGPYIRFAVAVLAAAADRLTICPDSRMRHLAPKLCALAADPRKIASLRRATLNRRKKPGKIGNLYS